MRARYPDAEGFVDRGGVKIGYEVFGGGEPAVVFAPVNPIVHSRVWKAQVPYLARMAPSLIRTGFSVQQFPLQSGCNATATAPPTLAVDT